MDCTQVKPGWYCGGEAGHEGPCAAWPACYYCGYLGPGLQMFVDLTSICPGCADKVRAGEAVVPGGDVTWDGSIWAWFKDAINRKFGW